jgi:plastocyanin
VTVRAATLLVAVTLIVCAAALAAAERTQPKTHTVRMENMRFEPETLTVARGDTVVWINKDLVPHTATSKAGGFDSDIVEAEKSWSLTVRKKGAFAYICAFHPTMTATLNVR